MISYETLLTEIEKHVASAKDLKDPQQLREQLSAIRALCEVALVKQNNTNTMPNQLAAGNMLNTTTTQTAPENQQSTLTFSNQQDSGANGSSIFEF